MYILHLVYHLPVDGWILRSEPLAVRNNATLDMGVHTGKQMLHK